MILLANGTVITRDPDGVGFIPDGGVVTDGGRIADIGETAYLKSKYPKAEFVDARDGVIMPGLINAHTHIYSALARGLSISGYAPTNFLEVLEGQWWYIDRNLDLAATRASAQALVMDCIKQGVTTIFDHHASFGQIPGSLAEIARVTREYGIRASLCYEVSDRDGEEKSIQSVQENKDFIDSCEKNPSDMLKPMFGGHALFTLSDRTFERMTEANNGRVGYHIHVAEGMNDVYDSLRSYGRRPVQRLQDHGILGPKTILGHCIHVNTAEMDLIRATDTMCVNNPESNLGNAVGIAPVLQLHRRGILIGLGTDAYTNDMLESIKVALIAQRHNACLPGVGWREVTDMLFQNNAKMAERCGFPTMGVLKPGAAADVIVMDYKPFTPLDHTNIDGHMLFGMTGRQCQTTMVNGRLLMRDRQLVNIDEEAVNAEILEVSRKLWGTLNHCKY